LTFQRRCAIEEVTDHRIRNQRSTDPLPLLNARVVEKGRIMKTNHLKGLCVLLTAISLALSVGVVHASQPIVIGCPLATAFL
jgi:hypothetical protein